MTNGKIEPGDKFGEWTVIAKSDAKLGYFLCRCSCGTEREVLRSSLLRGLSKSCGHSKRRVHPGEKYGRLTVIESVRENKMTFWICHCDCGSITKVRGNALLDGLSRSCGCLQKEITSELFRKPIEIGTKFGELTVIKELGTSDRGLVYLVRCSCGKEYEIEGSRLREGRKSCGHSIYKYNIGDKIGELEILEQIKIEGKKGYKCRCSCGVEKDIYEESLKNGTISCGHLNSRGEYKIIQLLQQNKINFIYQWADENFILSSERKCRFDFAVFKNKEDNIPTFFIEYNGSQHYFSRNSGWNTEENYNLTIQRDSEKAALCEKYNIPLEIIPYTEFNNLESIITSLLNKYEIHTIE